MQIEVQEYYKQDHMEGDYTSPQRRSLHFFPKFKAPGKIAIVLSISPIDLKAKEYSVPMQFVSGCSFVTLIFGAQFVSGCNLCH